PDLPNRLEVLDLLTTVSDHLPVVTEYYVSAGGSPGLPGRGGFADAQVAGLLLTHSPLVAVGSAPAPASLSPSAGAARGAKNPVGQQARSTGDRDFTDGVRCPAREDERGQYVEVGAAKVRGVWVVAEDGSDVPFVVRAGSPAEGR